MEMVRACPYPAGATRIARLIECLSFEHSIASATFESLQRAESAVDFQLVAGVV